MKTIAIVGGSSGIGAALVDLLKNTNNLVALCRSAVTDHPNVTHHYVDILRDQLPELDELNGLVYCPGSINLKPLGRLTTADFRDEFEINVIGAVTCIQHYSDALKKGNGSVVLFSTVATRLGMPFHASVAASKSAVEGLTKSLAAEYAPHVRFNAIAPTVTDTPLASKLLRNDRLKENMRERHPLKKYLEPIEVAQMASYLLSDQASAISGQVLTLDAGITSVRS